MALILRRGTPRIEDVPLGGGAVIRIEPATYLASEAAVSAARRDLAGLMAGSEGLSLLAQVFGPERFSVEALQKPGGLAAATVFLSEIYLVMECQRGWSGVLDESRHPIPEPTPEWIALLLNDPILNGRVMTAVNAGLHEESSEKNGSAASPGGGAGKEPGSAPAAGSPAIGAA